MAILNETTFANAMKVKYGSKLEKYWYDGACPFAKMVTKKGGLGGSSLNFGAAISPGNGGNDFGTAQANATVAEYEQRALTEAKTYVVGKIDNYTMYATKNGGAFEAAVQAQMDTAMETFSMVSSHQLWGNGGGARGRIATSGISSATITLSERADIVNFWPKLRLQLSSDDGNASSPAGVRAGSVLVVDSVNPDAGTITCTTNITSAISGAVQNDYIFREGDYGTCLKGVLAWVPVTAPTSGDSFFGVDRSTFVNRMAGSRVSATGSNMEDAIYDAGGELDLLGGMADTLFVGPLHYKELVKSLDSRAFSKLDGGKETLGVTGIEVAGHNGSSVKVISDRNCPDAYGLLTKMSDWELLYAGPGVPHFEETGGKMRVESTSDGLEFRLKAYWQLRNKCPKNNVLITWGS